MPTRRQHGMSDAEIVAWMLANTTQRGDCLEWNLARTPRGYGVTTYQNRYYRAHRLVFELTNGRIAGDQVVRHTCDNPSCVNPSHLLVGTHQDNMDDKSLRNRMPRGVDHWAVANPDKLLRGETHPRSQLTEAQARFALSSNVGGSELCKLFGVSKTVISMLRTRKTWKHLGGVAHA